MDYIFSNCKILKKCIYILRIYMFIYVTLFMYVNKYIKGNLEKVIIARNCK